MELPPLNALRTFEVVARHRSIKIAARELGVTTAAVRLSIRALEAYIDARLLERRGNALALTAAGTTLFESVRDAFQRLQHGARAVTGASGRELKLSVTPSVASRWLVPRLGDFREKNPEITISITTSMRVVDLTREDVDASIRFGRGTWPDLHSTPLTPSELVAVASPLLIGGTTLPLAALSHLPVVVVSSSPAEWERYAAAAGRAVPKAVMVVDTVQLALQAAEAAIGLAIARLILVEDALRAGTLCAPFAMTVPVETTYYFSTLPARNVASTPVRRFASWLLSSARANNVRDSR